MSITRFKKSPMPAHNPNLTAGENKDLERYVERVNNVKSAFNKLLDIIDRDGRQDHQDHQDCDNHDNNGPEMD